MTVTITPHGSSIFAAGLLATVCGIKQRFPVNERRALFESFLSRCNPLDDRTPADEVAYVHEGNSISAYKWSPPETDGGPTPPKPSSLVWHWVRVGQFKERDRPILTEDETPYAMDEWFQALAEDEARCPS